MQCIRNEEDLADFQARAPGPGITLVTFLAEWCAPSRRQRAILETLFAAYADRVPIGVVDVDQAEALCEKLEIRTLPASLLFVKGEIVESLPGFQQEKYLREYLDHYLQQHTPPTGAENPSS